VLAELTKKKDQLQLERDKAIQGLQSMMEEHETLKDQLKEAQAHTKQLEAELQDSNTAATSQLPRAYQLQESHSSAGNQVTRHPTPNTYQLQDNNTSAANQLPRHATPNTFQLSDNSPSAANQLPRHPTPNAYQLQDGGSAAANQLPRHSTTNAYQTHQMSQTAAVNPSYAAHNSDRAMNQGYPHLAATAGAQSGSVQILPGFTKAPSAHPNRNPLYANPNQQQSASPQWATPIYRYQQATPDNNLWNTPHMNTQMR
jgi:hypothetical protein